VCLFYLRLSIHFRSITLFIWDIWRRRDALPVQWHTYERDMRWDSEWRAKRQESGWWRQLTKTQMPRTHRENSNDGKSETHTHSYIKKQKRGSQWWRVGKIGGAIENRTAMQRRWITAYVYHIALIYSSWRWLIMQKSNLLWDFKRTGLQNQTKSSSKRIYWLALLLHCVYEFVCRQRSSSGSSPVVTRLQVELFPCLSFAFLRDDVLRFSI